MVDAAEIDGGEGEAEHRVRGRVDEEVVGEPDREHGAIGTSAASDQPIGRFNAASPPPGGAGRAW